MRAWELTEKFGLENLQLVEKERPEIGPGQVCVKVGASSLNFRDLVVIQGAYGAHIKTPLIPFSDGAGEVVEVGPGVTRFKPGDRVAPMFFQTWADGEPNGEKLAGALGGPLNGALTEHMFVREQGLAKIPESYSYEEAACLPCAALTAWSALIEQGNLRSGETVLVQGTGGVSLFALQIAKAAGAKVIITSSSNEKLERAKAMGADATVNYKENPDWHKAIKPYCDGEGVDHVIEVGGADTLEKSVRAVRTGGTVSLIGVLSGSMGEFPLPLVLVRNVRIQGVTVGSTAAFERMVRSFEQNGIKPVVDKVFDFEQAQEALGYLKSGKHFGKVVIKNN